MSWEIVKSGASVKISHRTPLYDNGKRFVWMKLAAVNKEANVVCVAKPLWIYDLSDPNVIIKNDDGTPFSFDYKRKPGKSWVIEQRF